MAHIGTPTTPKVIVNKIFSNPEVSALTNSFSRVCPLRGISKDVIQNLEHLVIVLDLLSTGWITAIRMLLRNLVKHLGEVHVDTRGAFYELFEFLKRGCELLGILGYMFGYSIQKFAMDTMVRWKPVGDPITEMLVLKVQYLLEETYLWTRCSFGM